MKHIIEFKNFLLEESLFNFFQPRPFGDIEVAKKDSLLAIKSFLKKYSGISDVDSLSEERLIELIKGFARNSKRSGPNKMAADIWKIAKPLF